MKSGKWLLLGVFVVAVGSLDAVAVRYSAGGEDERNEATFAEGALRQRILMLKDAQGRIPPDALMHAKAQADRLRGRGRGVNPAAAAAPQTSTPTSTTGAAAASSAAWRWLGPTNTGGRIRAIAIHPTNPNVIFIGSAGGGIWRSTDAGVTWAPCDDFMPALSVSTIVFDPRDPNVIYAGTGEGYHNGDAILGAGIFKSTDGGATWPRLPATAPAANPDLDIVNRLAISPDGSVLLVAGAWGLFRSTDQGASFTKTHLSYSWTQVAFSPTRANEAVATGYLGTVYYSRDAGQTWSPSSGFASVPSNARIELAYSKSDGSIYASVDVNGGMLYRSFDGGVSFAVASSRTGLLTNQGWYDNVIWVNPFDSNNVIVGGIDLYESQDGGRTLPSMGQYPLHSDHHVVVSDPRFDDVGNTTVYVGNDGGLFRTTDVRHTLVGSTGRWQELNNGLGITQFYGIDGNVTSGVILGGTQDTATQRYSGTSWVSGRAGDDGFVAADQYDARYFYTAIQYTFPYRSSDGGVSWQSIGSGMSDGTATNFIGPLLLDPNNRQRLYVGKNNLWRTDDAIGAAQFVSVKAPNPGGNDYVSAIAVAKGNADIVWVGYNYGSVYKTTNGTSATPAWTLVASFSNYISRITIDPGDPNNVFVTRTGLQPFNVRHSTDGGLTWAVATGAGATELPHAPVYDLEIDPFTPGVVYVATEVGVFRSTDWGANWEATGMGPANTRATEMFWMGGTLVVATHGRGVFALDVGPASGAPAVTLNPSSLTFASQAVGTAGAARGVTVSNTGNAPLSIQSVWIGGLDGQDFALAGDSCSGASVAAAGTCGVQVTFRPSASGTRSAFLWIADNASGSPHGVSLTGTGAATSTALPSPWTAQDIGAVGPAGTSTYGSGTFTVSGSGADVWGSADAFQFAYQPLTGDGAIVARVATVQPVAPWTKAGVMIRGALTPDSAHAFMLVSAGKGLAFQRRTTDAGVTTSTSGIAGTAPRWVKVERSASVVTASYSSDGTTWTAVGQDTIQLGSTAYVGLAMSSHDNAQLASATFDQVAVTAAQPPGTLAPGWASSDVGAVGAAGSASVNAGTFTVSGAGADVWGSADAFRYAYYTLPGDGSIVARVASVEYVAPWTKAGVMLRQSLAADSPHAFMLVSAGKGAAFQRRSTPGGLTTSTAAGTAAAPQWVKLVRAGQTVRAFTGIDGVTWTLVAQDTIAFSGSVWAGLAVSSHDTTRAAAATFDNVSVSVASTLPNGWQDIDIGGVGLGGSAGAGGGTFTVKGAGGDVWGAADALHYAYTVTAGDGEIVARVATVEYVAAWTKAGVMIRGSLDASAPQAFMLVSAGKGLAFQRRVSAGGLSTSTPAGAGTAPAWVRLVRSGSVISAYTSVDGASWTLVAQDTFAMSGSVYIGLAVSSHDTTRLATATFDGVAVR